MKRLKTSRKTAHHLLNPMEPTISSWSRRIGIRVTSIQSPSCDQVQELTHTQTPFSSTKVSGLTARNTDKECYSWKMALDLSVSLFKVKLLVKAQRHTSVVWRIRAAGSMVNAKVKVSAVMESGTTLRSTILEVGELTCARVKASSGWGMVTW